MQDLPPGGFDDGLGVTLVLVEGDLFGDVAEAKEVRATAHAFLRHELAVAAAFTFTAAVTGCYSGYVNGLHCLLHGSMTCPCALVSTKCCPDAQ